MRILIREKKSCRLWASASEPITGIWKGLGVEHWTINLVTNHGYDCEGNPIYDVDLEEFYGTEMELKAHCKELRERYDEISYAF